MYFLSEVFAVPVEGNALIYAPLLGVVAHVNHAGVRLLRRLEAAPHTPLQPAEEAFLRRLAEQGLTRDARGLRLCYCDEGPFQPLCVSLYLTNACNLRCRYCYARGGDAAATVLPYETAAAGVAAAADSAKRQGADGFAVSFHGAGEPTLAFDADEFGAAQLQFDPVLVTGRCLESGCGAVDPEAFAMEFMRASERARTRNVPLGFSVVSPEALRTYYCCAVSNGFTVSHNGLVTSCFDVYDASHRFADTFVYGRYNVRERRFELDTEKMAKLRGRHVKRLAACTRCFCKYMCCGDCTVNGMRAGLGLMEGGGRCPMTQSIAAHALAMRVMPAADRAPRGIVRSEGNDFTPAGAVWATESEDEPRVLAATRFHVQESHYMRPPPREECRRILIAAGNTAYRRHDYVGALWWRVAIR